MHKGFRWANPVTGANRLPNEDVEMFVPSCNRVRLEVIKSKAEVQVRQEPRPHPLLNILPVTPVEQTTIVLEMT